MDKLHTYGLTDVIKKCVERETPFLGICLGLQLLFESSEESPGVEGLHILDGKIIKIPSDGGLKVPHIGWNNLSYPNRGRLFKGIPENSYVYFVHSYYLKAEHEEDVTAVTEYGTCIHASVERNNVFACQFHPEKSSEVGLQILRNFIGITKGAE
jgi:glutamine amidotransferase